VAGPSGFGEPVQSSVHRINVNRSNLAEGRTSACSNTPLSSRFWKSMRERVVIRARWSMANCPSVRVSRPGHAGAADHPPGPVNGAELARLEIEYRIKPSPPVQRGGASLGFCATDHGPFRYWAIAGGWATSGRSPACGFPRAVRRYLRRRRRTPVGVIRTAPAERGGMMP
jgi:hypothetical protein